MQINKCIMFKAIILDFDGVILESIDVKTKAFLKVYASYPEHADAIAQYHLKNGGISRYKKFVHIHNEILGKPISEQDIEEMAMIFATAVDEGIKTCPFVHGAQAFLSKYSKVSPIFIASGTPEDELRKIVAMRNIDQYFKGVYGTPRTKAEIINSILHSEKISSTEAVFVGDAISDYEGAKETGVPFIARINDQVPENPFLNMDVCTVLDLEELDKLFSKRY